MCKYCEEKEFKTENIFEIEVLSDSAFGWTWEEKIKIARKELGSDDYGLFIDRGYLRFVMLNDCDCLDHGDKIEISFCPFCGRDLKGNEEE